MLSSYRRHSCSLPVCEIAWPSIMAMRYNVSAAHVLCLKIGSRELLQVWNTEFEALQSRPGSLTLPDNISGMSDLLFLEVGDNQMLVH